MGTRADFYIGRGKEAQWIGSIAWDGYPDDIDKELLDAKTEDDFKVKLGDFFAGRNDVALPDNGWPWPWDDSNTTDYAYAFDEGTVHASRFGSDWFDPKIEMTDDEWERVEKGAEFPNMKERQNVVLSGPSSGLIIISAG